MALPTDDQTNRSDPAEDRNGESWFIHREIVGLILLCVIVVVGIVGTRTAASANRALRYRDAAVLYQLGRADLDRRKPSSAVQALRRAAAIDRDNRRYQLDYAAALTADGQDEAATRVLLAVRESAPEDPDVNLQLARLTARRDDVTEAVRYYQNAVYGVRSVDDAASRRAMRIELIRYLLAHGDRGRALAELLVLSGNLPEDVPAHIEAGRLFLEADEPRRALDHFRRVLTLEPGNTDASAGAGEAAFGLADYAGARRYLRAAPGTERTARLLAVVDAVLTYDPLQAGLPFRERQERLLIDFEHAATALDACLARQTGTGTTDAAALREEATAIQSTLTPAQLRRSPETIESALALIWRIEDWATRTCGQQSPLDRALLLIGQRHELDRR